MCLCIVTSAANLAGTISFAGPGVAEDLAAVPHRAPTLLLREPLHWPNLQPSLKDANGRNGRCGGDKVIDKVIVKPEASSRTSGQTGERERERETIISPIVLTFV